QTASAPGEQRSGWQGSPAPKLSGSANQCHAGVGRPRRQTQGAGAIAEGSDAALAPPVRAGPDSPLRDRRRIKGGDASSTSPFLGQVAQERAGTSTTEEV